MYNQGFSPYPRGQGGPASGLPPGANFEVIGIAFERFKERPGPYIAMSLLYIFAYAIQTGLGFFLNGGPASASNSSTDINEVFQSSLLSSGYGLLGSFMSTTVLMALVCGVVEMLKHPGESGHEFAGFKRFFPLLGLVVITQIVITLGFLLCFFPGLLLMGLFSLAPMLVVQKKMGVVEAMTESIEKMKPYMLAAGALILVLNILFGFSFFLCCVGALVGGPIMMISYALHFLSNYPDELGAIPPPEMGPEARF